MSDQIPTTPIPPSIGPSITSRLATLWRSIIPWEQLQAKEPPQRYLEVGSDIIPTLAVLTALGPDGPHLVNVDQRGNLLNTLSFTTVAISQDLAGTSTIHVPDSNAFTPGHFFVHIAQTGDINKYRVRTIVDKNTVQIFSTLNLTVNTGDPISSVQFGIVDNRPTLPGNFAQSAPAVGNQASLNLPGRVGQSIVIHYLIANMQNQSAAGAQTRDVLVYDGTVATGTVILDDQLTTNATSGDKDRLTLPNALLVSQSGNEMNVVLGPAIVGIRFTLNVSWYYQ